MSAWAPSNGSRLSCGALKKDSFPNVRAPPASSACYAARSSCASCRALEKISCALHRQIGKPLGIPFQRHLEPLFITAQLLQIRFERGINRVDEIADMSGYDVLALEAPRYLAKISRRTLTPRIRQSTSL